MDWRDEMKTQASFRGVPFKTVDAEQRVGRRTVLHEYPQRNAPFTEDMGRRARQYVVDGYVLGDDYLQQRDALIAAIEEDGPGELVHPRYGYVWVAVQDYVSVKESQREGGKASFSITFVEHGDNEFPRAVVDTVAQVESAATAVDAANAEQFGKEFNTAGLAVVATSALAALKKDLDAQLALVRRVTSTAELAAIVSSVAGVSGSLTALIRTPVNLAQSIIGLSALLSLTVARPFNALAELRSVFGGNPRPSGSALKGSTRGRLLANESARSDLQRRTALANQARVLSVALTLESLTAVQARQLRDAVLGQLDGELEDTDPPAAVASALTQLRTAVAADVRRRGEMLRESSTFNPQAVLPALVLAHRIYQDATRADELVLRNGIRHPAFVPVQPLEVLL